MATKRADGYYTITMVLRGDEYKGDFLPKLRASGLSESGYLRASLGYKKREKDGETSADKASKKAPKKRASSRRKKADKSSPKFRTQRVPEEETSAPEVAHEDVQPLSVEMPETLPDDLSVLDFSPLLDALGADENLREPSPEGKSYDASEPLDLGQPKTVDLESLPPEVWHLVK